MKLKSSEPSSRSYLQLLLLTLILATASISNAVPSIKRAGNKYVKASIVSATNILQPSERPTLIGVKFDIEPGWHIYWKNSGDAAIPTKIKWRLPEQWSFSDLLWPAPLRFMEPGEITTFGYENQTALLTEISPDVNYKRDTVTIEAEVSWLVCKHICVPGSSSLKKEIPFSKSLPIGPSKDWPTVEKYLKQTPQNDIPESSITSVPSEISISDTGAIELKLEQLKEIPTAKLKSLVQIYPHKTTGIKYLSPGVATDKHSLILPFQFTASAKEELTTLSGTIALNGKALDTAGTYYNWETTVKPTQGSPRKSSFDTSQLEHLTFNYIQKEAEGMEVIQPKESDVVSSATRPENNNSMSVLTAVLYAFIAGIILNAMPCVLPVLSIKLFSLCKCNELTVGQRVKPAALYTAGILSSMLTLAGVVVLLRSLGHSLGWGFQFQYPGFVLVLLVVIFLFSLSFFDLYFIKVKGLSAINDQANKIEDSNFKHFFDGIVTTALSTPCTAPYLGSAVAFAISKPSWVIFAIFASVALGLAFPYCLVALNPKLSSILPKPGNWMNGFKHFLGFILIATCIWLYSVLSSLIGQDSSIYALVLLLAVFASVWVLRSSKKTVFTLVILAMNIALSIYLWPTLTTVNRESNTAQNNSKLAWVNYSPDHIFNRDKNSPAIFIDFTADWCITCQLNKKSVIETEEIIKSLNAHSVLPVKADWTTGDEKITQALTHFGRSGVPLYVLYPQGNSKPVILPTLLTKSSLTETIVKISGKQ